MVSQLYHDHNTEVSMTNLRLKELLKNIYLTNHRKAIKHLKGSGSSPHCKYIRCYF